jgi:biotin carboxyl carrier protein
VTPVPEAEPIVVACEQVSTEAWRAVAIAGDRAVAARLTSRDRVHGRLEIEGGGSRHGVLLPPPGGAGGTGSDRPSDRRPRPAGIPSIEVIVDGWRFVVDVEPARRAALREIATRAPTEAGADGPTEVRAIIPGRVVSIAVATGETVTSGTRLLVVEAMKMQNELRAPRDGRVTRIAVAEGETIEVGDLLVVVS